MEARAQRFASAGETLRRARQRGGLSQAALARRAGTSQAAVSDIERGKVQPTVDRLQRLLRHTGHDLVLELRPEPPPAVDAEDLALLVRNLTLTPAERLAQLTNRMRLRGLARR